MQNQSIVSNIYPGLKILKELLDTLNLDELPKIDVDIVKELQKNLNAILASPEMPSEKFQQLTKVLISHLDALQFKLEIELGESKLSDFRRAIKSQISKIQLLLTHHIILNEPFTSSNASIFKSLMTEEDKIVIEKQRAAQQASYNNKVFFKRFLQRIWQYTICQNIPSLSVFISYAWPEEDARNEAWTKDYILRLASHLRQTGIRVYLDEDCSQPGHDLSKHMGRIYSDAADAVCIQPDGWADHVLLFSARTYMVKFNRPESGTKQEYVRIEKRLNYNSHQRASNFAIPILLNIDKFLPEEPINFNSLVEINFCKSNYLHALKQLIKSIYKFGTHFDHWYQQCLNELQLGYFSLADQAIAYPIERTQYKEKLIAALNTVRTLQQKHIFVSGASGVGKSCFIQQFCFEHYGNDFYQIHWIDATNQESIIRYFKKLQNIIIQEEIITIEDVKSWLANQSDCLVIFDNVADFNAIKRFIPLSVTSIFICNNCPLLSESVPVIDVNDFSQEEARAYLEKAAVDDVDAIIKESGTNPKRLAERVGSIQKATKQFRLLESPQELSMVRRHAEEQKLLGNYNANVFNLPYQSAIFIGRGQQLIDIHDNVRPSVLAQVDATKKILVCGMGGLGKTTLVAHYVTLHANKFRNVFWFKATNAANLAYEIKQLCVNLTGTLAEDTHIEISEIFKHWLITHPGNLLVFDDAENYEMLQAYIPALGNSIIITSRHHVNWPIDDWRRIDLNEFTDVEACNYIKKSLGNIFADESYRTLAEVFKLPLALAQAVAYILQNKETCSPNQFIELFNHKKEQLIDLNTVIDGQDYSSLFATWDLSISKIYETSKLAYEILLITALLSNHGIPFKILEAYSKYFNNKIGENESLTMVVGLLRDYSLLSSNNEGSVYLHAIVRDVILEKLRREEQINIKYKKLLAAFVEHLRPLLFDVYDITLFHQFEPHLAHLMKRLYLQSREDVSRNFNIGVYATRMFVEGRAMSTNIRNVNSRHSNTARQARTVTNFDLLNQAKSDLLELILLSITLYTYELTAIGAKDLAFSIALHVSMPDECSKSFFYPLIIGPHIAIVNSINGQYHEILETEILLPAFEFVSIGFSDRNMNLISKDHVQGPMFNKNVQRARFVLLGSIGIAKSRLGDYENAINNLKMAINGLSDTTYTDFINNDPPSKKHLFTFNLELAICCIKTNNLFNVKQPLAVLMQLIHFPMIENSLYQAKANILIAMSKAQTGEDDEAQNYLRAAMNFFMQREILALDLPLDYMACWLEAMLLMEAYSIKIAQRINLAQQETIIFLIKKLRHNNPTATVQFITQSNSINLFVLKKAYLNAMQDHTKELEELITITQQQTEDLKSDDLRVPTTQKDEPQISISTISSQTFFRNERSNESDVFQVQPTQIEYERLLPKRCLLTFVLYFQLLAPLCLYIYFLNQIFFKHEEPVRENVVDQAFGERCNLEDNSIADITHQPGYK